MKNFIRFLVKFLLILIVLGILLGLLYVYARYIEPNMLTINEEKLEDSSHNLKIVFFSDTHFSDVYKTENIERIVEKINAQNADIVIFGGDFIDKYNQDEEHIDLEYLSEKLSEIKASYGKFAVWGNHDKGGGAAWIYEDTMNNGGFTVLLNQSIYLEKQDITIKGLDDYLLGKPDLSVCKDNNEGYTILISHAPDIASKGDLKEIDLVLGAHSHGGQVSLPFITKKILPKGAQEYVKGMYTTEDGAKMFVSKGLGTTQLPYRFLNTPEIAVIEVNMSK